ncbi:hypothetical protein ACFPOE_15360 [Caenimonas terrae]|uniref:DUF2158 domain-containing protein n=1 Tax=Caenimonas terrae TaxID=696074 RepID=A0ABW0NG64_9BURK
MSQHAIIRGEVSFRAGDGPLIPIPDGPVEMELAADSVTFSWVETDGTHESAAIPRDEYERYVKEGHIKLVNA